MGKADQAQLHDAIVGALMARRKSQDLSHEKLAARVGVSRAAISFIESGDRKPSLLLCLRMAAALDCSLADIIATAENRTPATPGVKT